MEQPTNSPLQLTTFAYNCSVGWIKNKRGRNGLEGGDWVLGREQGEDAFVLCLHLHSERWQIRKLLYLDENEEEIWPKFSEEWEEE